MSQHEYEGWAIVEIAGGRECAGRVVMGADPLVRIDVPVNCAFGDHGYITEFWNRSAIFSIRPCAENIARQLLKHYVSPGAGAVRLVDDYTVKMKLPDFATASRLMETAQ